MAEKAVTTEIDSRGVATVRINRAERANAYNGAVIDGLYEAAKRAAADDAVRVVVLRGTGRHFCGGADLAFLKEMGAATEARNREFSVRTTGAVRALNELPKPTIAAVSGACYGGGMGMAASCDIAIGAEDCAFGLTEVRFGIVWSPIAHVMDAAIGTRETRRYALSGERFGAAEALRIGLLHEVVAAETLDPRVEAVTESLLANGPAAMAEAKALVLDLAGLRMDDETLDEIAQEAAAMRAGSEAREGLSAFLEKRPPAWAPR
ncbi:MAG: hypothetical protein HOK81_13685 [Rhodospirillaceae bacterium]|jgi:methylglutaconyl-CoA hydratase|nr:hypothetical protein [Rhodospirillaceae bacterium]